MTAQIILLTLFLISLLINANQHGKPKTGNYNFWYPAISLTIMLGLLYWGGFFDVFFK